MFVVLALLSAVCAVVPMLSFLGFVWWLDRYDREPLWLVILTFLWGAIGSVFLALIGSSALMVPLTAALGPERADDLSAVLIAPIIEEPTKALILFLLLFSRHFDNASDGFVYGAAAGLGFGMTENFVYFVNVAASGDPVGWATTVLIRTFFSAVMHACATSAVGAMLGFARFRGLGARLAALPVGFGVAMGVHALWNGLLTLDALHGEGGWTSLNLLLFPVEVVIFLAVFQLALWEERATLRRELADEVTHGLLPLAHARAVASWWGRARSGWVPNGVPREQYIQAVTTLAQRKHQCRNASAARYPFYADEVVRLRREVAALLALARA
jgi:RsiW-degrading membrane proteinase PrsW (M82 family)